MALDRECGDTRLLEIRTKVAAGTFKHLRLQVEEQVRTVIDRYCFITTAIYGPDVTETNSLRA